MKITSAFLIFATVTSSLFERSFPITSLPITPAGIEISHRGRRTLAFGHIGHGNAQPGTKKIVDDALVHGRVSLQTI